MPGHNALLSWSDCGEFLRGARASYPGEWSMALAYLHPLGDKNAPGVWSVCVTYKPLGGGPTDHSGKWESFGPRGTWKSATEALHAAGQHVVGQLAQREAQTARQHAF